MGAILFKDPASKSLLNDSLMGWADDEISLASRGKAVTQNAVSLFGVSSGTELAGSVEEEVGGARQLVTTASRHGSQDFTTIDAGATLELASAYSGTVSFAGATGTLIIDHSSSFSGTIAGQLAIGNVIDLADITGGANVTIAYSGNNSPGTLTVSDGTHTANIALDGNYSLANFTASSDGHGGTFVIDPPLLPAGVTLRPIDGGSNYYGDHGLAYAHNAGWDNPGFFPVGPFLAPMQTQADANRWLDLGLNTAFNITGNSSISLLASNGLWAIQSSDALLPGTGAETVGLRRQMRGISQTTERPSAARRTAFRMDGFGTQTTLLITSHMDRPVIRRTFRASSVTRTPILPIPLLVPTGRPDI